MQKTLEEKYARLCAALEPLGSLAIAFSGGADSTLLTRVAHDVLGDNTLAVTASSEIYPVAELEAAKEIASQIGVPHVVITTRELDLPGFRLNPPDRCYHCKRDLFRRVREEANARGIRHVADGSNADDVADYRPGSRAIEEMNILTPLRNAGFTKSDVRSLSQELGLPTWDKPARACLASRFPYGAEITPEKLEMVEQAEARLHELGFDQCRVRHHGDIARIEVEPGRTAELAALGVAAAVVRTFRQIGFRYVALDLEGYRMGSMNATLSPEKRG